MTNLFQVQEDHCCCSTNRIGLTKPQKCFFILVLSYDNLNRNLFQQIRFPTLWQKSNVKIIMLWFCIFYSSHAFLLLQKSTILLLVEQDMTKTGFLRITIVQNWFAQHKSTKCFMDKLVVIQPGLTKRLTSIPEKPSLTFNQPSNICCKYYFWMCKALKLQVFHLEWNYPFKFSETATLNVLHHSLLYFVSSML